MTQAFDQYFTPAWVADMIANSMPGDFEGAVMDPSAGEGALLQAVVRRFGSKVAPMAIDIDRRTVADLQEKEPDWSYSTADVLSINSRRASSVWRSARSRGIAGAVLNPPFSFRGGAGHLTSFGSFAGRLSPAVAFVAIALEELAPIRGLWAVLPNGALEGEKNEEFWSAVGEMYNVNREHAIGTSAFRGARVRADVVAITPMQAVASRTPDHHVRPILGLRQECVCVDVIRGRVPMHAFWPESEGQVEWTHTSDLRNGAVTKSGRSAPHELATSGVCVLIPRVGNPHPLKVVLDWRSSRVLSDCIFAIRPLVSATSVDLHATIRTSENLIASMYRGTGAQYITAASVVAYLRAIGWNPRRVAANEASEPCSCGRERSAPVATAAIGGSDERKDLIAAQGSR